MARLPLATRLVMKLDVWAVRFTGGSFFMWLYSWHAGLRRDPDFRRRKARALVLVTQGRRSGLPRAVALPYFTFEGRTFVVGSKGGAPEDPDWVLNLRKTPGATVYRERRRQPVTTRFASPAERALLWPQLVDAAPTYADYQRGTRREIPLVIIDGAASFPA
ncbi:MAG: nitroreductase family deazaflavin-dependent oxidoreductase [Proteobacteria bacterium]|nr:nitroreductase family deazaflavin-dependent oxidoreductase [Pseudomonadota bacterium]